MKLKMSMKLLFTVVLLAAGLMALQGCGGGGSGEAEATTSIAAPSITTQPSLQTVMAGSAATLSVTASSSGIMTYQWYKGTVAISGATMSSYALSSAVASDAGSYHVAISNSGGTTTSNTVTLTVETLVAPTISSQPAATTVTEGAPATFSVTATGSGILSYQWFKDGSALAGANQASYAIASATTASAGSYHVAVTNAAGSTTSASATLVVTTASTFGLTTTTDFYTVDTDAGVVFNIRRTDNGVSTQSAGDIASLKIKGVEFQDQSRGSQLNSGFDWLYSTTSAVTVSAAVVDANFICITVVAGNLTHYYLARKGYPHIYMADTFTAEPDVHGQVRYILRLLRGQLPNGPAASDIAATVSTVESSDIFALANGETRSKHYSNERAKDWQYIGATGTNVGVWVVRDNQEGSSGGPFYRSLLNQGTTTNQEITYIVNYGEAQTEAFRMGILNQYTLVVTDGSAPSANIDTSWFSAMGLSGYVGSVGRGSVSAPAINGRDAAFTYTVGFANSTAQYWVTAAVTNGAFSSANMRPGTYTMTTYKNELAVDTRSVTVTAAGTTVLDAFTITGDPSSSTAIWRIGDWDGSPAEFLNGGKLTTMHPSDVRMAHWDPVNYVIGTSSAIEFPAYLWKDINNDHVVLFKLTSAQLVAAHRLRIGITCAFAGGRPKITVNGWSSSNPSPSSQPSTRTLTVGTYRGNNTSYSFDVPASAWKTGVGEFNALTITIISGTTSTGYLSPSISVDSIDLLN